MGQKLKKTFHQTWVLHNCTLPRAQWHWNDENNELVLQKLSSHFDKTIEWHCIQPELNWIWILIQFSWFQNCIEYISNPIQSEIGFRFNWRETKCKLMDNVLKICYSLPSYLWLWCWKELQRNRDPKKHLSIPLKAASTLISILLGQGLLIDPGPYINSDVIIIRVFLHEAFLLWRGDCACETQTQGFFDHEN
jgi:hypothetical protein